MKADKNTAKSAIKYIIKNSIFMQRLSMLFTSKICFFCVFTPFYQNFSLQYMTHRTNQSVKAILCLGAKPFSIVFYDSFCCYMVVHTKTVVKSWLLFVRLVALHCLAMC